MKFASVLAVAIFEFGLVQALPPLGNKWHGPGVGDVRGPCPMLNTLANHDYLPHSGKGITLNTTVKALSDALNIEEGIATNLFGFALTTNPEGNTTGVFSLKNLGTHNILEHDASLSRADYDITKDSVSFNKTIFARTRSFWKTEQITFQQAADARLAQYTYSQKNNPKYSMSPLGDQFSAGESAAYLFIMGDFEKLTAPKKFVEYLFENERLPTAIGWKKPAHRFTGADLNYGINLIYNATKAPEEQLSRMRARREIHGGSWA